jgi:hypothetical protein
VRINPLSPEVCGPTTETTHHLFKKVHRNEFPSLHQYTA